MTVRYVKSAGSNTSPYDTWAKAATTLATAIAAAGAGDIIYVDSAYSESNATGTTYAPDGVAVISTSDTTNNPPTTINSGASIATTGLAALFINAGYWRGFTFTAGSNSSSSTLTLAGADNLSVRLEDCACVLGTTNSSGSITTGVLSTAASNCLLGTRNCSFKFGATGQKIVVRSPWLEDGSTFAVAGSVPTTLFSGTTFPFAMRFNGSDLSAITGTLFSGSFATWGTAHLTNCKIGSGVTIIGAQTQDGSGEIFLTDCASGDVNYAFGHYDYRGKTEATASKYVTADGATYDLTNRFAVTITGVNATFYQPYRSPWFDSYSAGGSSVTPYFEIARDGSTTAYKDDEVWCEVMAKVTAGNPITSLYTDRRAFLSSNANQAAGAGTGAWTGLGGTAWSGKVDSGGALTPAELGLIRGRVCLGANVAVVVDPQLRGL